MCGIAGIINFNKIDKHYAVNEMLDAINFRGPDFKNVTKGEFFSAGMVRLSILDLSNNGNQPFLSSDGKILVFYNGEIYNHKELKKKYFANHNFSSSCDGEILPILFKKFGKDFVKHLKGMFSICIIDKNKKEILLIRDRFGIKPLYYNFNSDKSELTFCSEIHPLFKNKKIKKYENYSETNRYLNLGLVNATNETWFKNIYQIEPGQMLIYKKNQLNFHRYYKLSDYIDEDNDIKESNFFKLEKEIFNYISESFKQHSISDQPIGIHISGGNDSAALAVGCKKNNLHTKCYTFDYEETNFSEKNDALEISSSLGFDHSFSKIKNTELISEFEKVVKIQYEPFSSLRIVSQNHLYETYKDSCKVILDGSGGDEIAAGYKYYQVAWMLDMLKDGYKNSHKKLFKLATDQETINKSQFLAGSLMKILENNNVTEDGSSYENSNILNMNSLAEFKNIYQFESPFKSILRNVQFKDLMYTKLPRCLRYVDRASMRYSIETRLPLLDHELVQKFFSLPTKYKFIKGYQRMVLKNFSKSKLNQKIIFKNKRTIADPQSYWLKTNLKNYVQDILNSRFAKEDEIINSDKLLELFKKLFSSKKHYNSFFLFQCLNYIVWKKNVLNENND